MKRTPQTTRKRMPKVLFITTSDGIGGMTRVVLALVRQFVAREWAVRVVFPETEKSHLLVDWARDQGVSAETSPAVRDIVDTHSLADMLALRRLVRAAKPDIVNLHYGENYISLKDVLTVRFAGRHRVVVTVYHPVPWSSMNPRKRLMTRLSALLADDVIVISNATRNVLLEAGVPRRAMHVIPCGLPIPDALPGRLEARGRLGLPCDAFVVSTLARLVPHKGIADLIAAAADISDPLGMLRLVVAGDGPERPVLERQAALHLGERALFVGQLSDAATADVYAAANVFVLPSYEEGFGLVYIEAAFHGVPSIGARVGGVPEAIAEGQTGLLIPAGDSARLASAMQRLRDDIPLRQRLGDAARERARAQFSAERAADCYEHIFTSRRRKRLPLLTAP